MKTLFIIIALILVSFLISAAYFYPAKQESTVGIFPQLESSHLETSKTTIQFPEFSSAEFGKTQIPYKMDDSINSSSTIEVDKEADVEELESQATVLDIFQTMNAQDSLADDMKHSGLLIEKAMLDSGFTEESAQKISSGDPKNLLSIDEMPDAYRDSISSDLERIKKEGYDEVEYNDEIFNIMNYLLGTTYPITNLSFSPVTIPSLMHQHYQYMGHTFSGTYLADFHPSNVIHKSVRRVFQSLDASHLLILEESHFEAGGANLIKEFVNTRILGYPGILMLKKTAAGESYTMLNWAIPHYAFTLYYLSTNGSQNTDLLILLANSITEVNSRF